VRARTCGVRYLPILDLLPAAGFSTRKLMSCRGDR
jgi:hypothetical protein